MAVASITVGEAARRAGVSRKAVRLYEAKGILPPAERTESGYRTYSEADIQVLRFIRRARALGLRLEEIGRILDVQRRGAQPCGTVVQLLEGPPAGHRPHHPGVASPPERSRHRSRGGEVER